MTNDTPAATARARSAAMQAHGGRAHSSRPWLFVRRNPTAAASVLVLLVIALAALFAPLVAPYSPHELNPVNRLQGPSLQHLFGTDAVGQDVFSRVIYGGRVSLVVGVAVAAVSSFIGTIVGMCAGMFRRLDMPLMRLMDGLMAFPGLLLALALVAALGPHVMAVIIILATVQTPYTARLMRSAALKLRSEQYVEAAQSVGVGSGRILWRYMLPNAMAPLLVQATFHFATAVLDEAALSFLGTGVPPTTPTWGNIIGAGRTLFQQAPWLTIFPGIAIVLTVLAMSIVGDALRDTLDPTLARQA